MPSAALDHSPDTSRPLRSVGILGGGVCGLAAAYQLLQKRPGLQVTVLESEDYPGGLARTLTFSGLRTDLGPHRIHTELAGILDFLRDLVGEDIVEVCRSSRMWLDGRWVEYPPRPTEMLRLLGPFRLAGFVASYAAARLFGVGTTHTGKENFRSEMERAFGPKLYEFLVRPYTEKVWKSPPETLHADVARVRVSAGGLNRLVKQAFLGSKQPSDAAALKTYHYIRGGIGLLAERMAGEIIARGGILHLNRTVVGLQPGTQSHPPRNASGWQVSHAASPGSESTAQSAQLSRIHSEPPPHEDLQNSRFDAVLSTLPVTDLVRFLGADETNPSVAKAAGDLRFLANLLVYVVVNEPLRTQNQWLYFPHPDLIFNRGYVPANFDPTLARHDKAVLCLEVTCFPGDATWNLDNAQLAARVAEDIAKTGLVRRNSVQDVHVFRIPYTYPFYDLDYRDKTDRIWEHLANVEGLLSVGRQGLFLHNNIDHSVYMGLEAADALLADPVSPGPGWYRRIREFQGFRIVD